MAEKHRLKRLDRQTVCEGAVLDFCRDTVELPDGQKEQWDFVHHRRGGGACAVPVLQDGRVLMIRQYRPAVGRDTLELPAGGRDGQESPEQTAARELREETGFRAGRLRYLCSLDTAVAYCDERTDIFLATELRAEGDQQPDEAEDIRVSVQSAGDILRGIREGRIRDAKTVAGILAWLALREETGETAGHENFGSGADGTHAG